MDNSDCTPVNSKKYSIADIKNLEINQWELEVLMKKVHHTVDCEANIVSDGSREYLVVNLKLTNNKHVEVLKVLVEAKKELSKYLTEEAAMDTLFRIVTDKSVVDGKMQGIRDTYKVVGKGDFIVFNGFSTESWEKSHLKNMPCLWYDDEVMENTVFVRKLRRQSH